MPDYDFDRVAQSPVMWQRSARQLKMAADALWSIIQEDLDRFDASRLKEIVLISLGPIWLLVAGLAIENLIKAILVRQKKLVLKDGELPGWFCTHKISDLCKRAAVQLTESQQTFVGRLEKCITWRGKYPTPRKPFPGVDLRRSFAASEAEKFEFEALYKRLQAAARPSPRRSLRRKP